jgi:O6-methylguanine-DNA--protein-cysteine methyltransferase
VIGSNGKMAGYRFGLQIKAHLLELEKQHGDL